jgi:GMP reductase
MCHLSNFIFQLPVIPANMECVINDEIALKLADAGFFYIHHRFNVSAVDFSRKMKQVGLPVSISLGVNADSYTLLEQLAQENLMPDFGF